MWNVFIFLLLFTLDSSGDQQDLKSDINYRNVIVHSNKNIICLISRNWVKGLVEMLLPECIFIPPTIPKSCCSWDSEKSMEFFIIISDKMSYRGIPEKGSGDVVSAVCYTVYTIYLYRCIRTAETASPEPFSWIPPYFFKLFLFDQHKLFIFDQHINSKSH